MPAFNVLRLTTSALCALASLALTSCVPPPEGTCYGELKETLTTEHEYDPQTGTVRAEASSRTVNIYDGLRRLNQRLIDTDNNGTVDVIILYTYDDFDNVIRETTDNDADGTVDSIIERVFDDSNRLLVEDLDTDADGVFDSRIVLTYNAYGDVEQEQTFAYGDDEIPLTTVRREYTCMGPGPRQIRQEGGT